MLRGRAPNTGKRLAKEQLMSSSGKTNNPRKNTTWLTHVAEFRKANPSIKSKDVFREAKKTYSKSATAKRGGKRVDDGRDTYTTNGKDYVIINNQIYEITVDDDDEMVGLVDPTYSTPINDPVVIAGIKRQDPAAIRKWREANEYPMFVRAKKRQNPNITVKKVIDMWKTRNLGGVHCGGELELIQEASSAQPIQEADTPTAPAVDIHQIDVEKEDKAPPPMKKDTPMVQRIMVEKTAGQVPAAPKEQPKKSEDEQNNIMVDIMNSYDEFNKRFEEISNSNASVANKRSQYEHERDRIGKYHESSLNYGNVLSADKMKLEERAFRYALETFKIGLQSLADGEPQQRVDFENFDDNATITEIIDKALEFPRGPLDRAKSFYSVPIKDSPIQSFNPVIPALGKMATIYPYGRQMAQKQISGGKVAKKSPKQIIKELTRDMFIRDMMRIFPNKSKKQIMNAYDKKQKRY